MKRIFNLKRRIKKMITSLNMKTATVTNKLNIVSNKPEWKTLCKECFSATKKSGWTQKDSKKLLNEIRERENF